MHNLVSLAVFLLLAVAAAVAGGMFIGGEWYQQMQQPFWNPPAPLMAFGLGGLFTLVPSMVADVVDTDELQTGERREGMYGSIFWWVVKLGMALALAGGGFLLNATGFDVDLMGAQTDQTIFLMRFFDVMVPLITSGLAMWAIASFSITEEKAHEVRTELEARRGVAEVAPA